MLIILIIDDHKAEFYEYEQSVYGALVHKTEFYEYEQVDYGALVLNIIFYFTCLLNAGATYVSFHVHVK